MKSGRLDGVEFARALGTVGIFLNTAEIAALARGFGDGTYIEAFVNYAAWP